MSSIRIIATPPGQAPEWVREAWVGIEIPLTEQESGLVGTGVLGGPPENTGGYQVFGSDAFRALTLKSPEAAQWWLREAPWALGNKLVFARDVCKVID